ncbi:MscL family protein [Acidimicrobiales bacterium]|nr:MscL family protein [Acidimicrobiales bacterium]MDC1388802.1 MscL family protein [Acidimicrobiales bacterium]
MLQEFKDFVQKGGIFEAAVGLIMALAFVPVVTAIIDGILMPIIAAIVGEPNFDGITIGIGDAEILIGTVITAIVSFLAVAAVVFMMVKAHNNATSASDEDAGPSDIDLLTQIRDSLAK